jgi:diacylglycerol kinase (ATP)
LRPRLLRARRRQVSRMSERRATLIHNPSAGDETPSAGDLRQILSSAGFQVRYASSKKGWKKALDKPSDLVVVAGGDGTVADVALHLAGSNIPLAILPLGRANNVARSLGLIGDARDIVDAWDETAVGALDIGVAAAPWGEARFVESAGAGIFAELIVRAHVQVDDSQMMLGAEGDRALLLVRQIVADADAGRWHVELDGRDLSGEYLGIEAMNTRFIGPKVPLAPDADPGDGLLDVVLIGPSDRQALLDYLAGRLHDSAADLPRLPVERGRHLTLRPSRAASLHVGDELFEPPTDTESKPEWMFDILLQPAAVSIIAAPRSRDAG